MIPARQHLFQTFTLTLLACLLAAHPVRCQGGPPPLPPYPPGNALNFWPLEKAPWGSAYGDPARDFTNVSTVASWDYPRTSLGIDTNVLPAFLNLEVFEPYGGTNFSVSSNGSFSFWYSADYTSVADGGDGCADWAALLTVGHYTTNASAGSWLLVIDPPASNCLFIAQSSNGSIQVVFDAPIDLTAGEWREFCVTYTQTNGCCLYLDGQLVTNTGPILCGPSASECLETGMFVGSIGTAGLYQCRG